MVTTPRPVAKLHLKESGTILLAPGLPCTGRPKLGAGCVPNPVPQLLTRSKKQRWGHWCGHLQQQPKVSKLLLYFPHSSSTDPSYKDDHMVPELHCCVQECETLALILPSVAKPKNGLNIIRNYYVY